MALAGYFSEGEGETLTYTAASSAVAVATVSVLGSTLTITAVGVGSAVVTVTATDADSLTAKQTINVTVTAAADPTDPITSTELITPTTPADPVGDTVTISGKKAEEVDLTKHLPAGAAAADYELESRDPSVFTVAKKAASTSVWEITPVSFGTDKAEIIVKADGAVEKILTVTVDNRAPEVKATADPPLVTMVPWKEHAPEAPAKAMKNANGDYALNLYSVVLPAGAQFSDPDDADAGKLAYTITPSRQDVIVQDGGTCTTASCTVWVDIVTRRTSADEFDLNVVATDAAKATSASVAFPIRMEPPAPQTYNVDQFKVTYNFRPVSVGYRGMTEHTLVFKRPDVPGGKAGRFGLPVRT